jgi:hypothetical protein
MQSLHQIRLAHIWRAYIKFVQLTYEESTSNSFSSHMKSLHQICSVHIWGAYIKFVQLTYAEPASNSFSSHMKSLHQICSAHIWRAYIKFVQLTYEEPTSNSLTYIKFVQLTYEEPTSNSFSSQTKSRHHICLAHEEQSTSNSFSSHTKCLHQICLAHICRACIKFVYKFCDANAQAAAENDESCLQKCDSASLVTAPNSQTTRNWGPFPSHTNLCTKPLPPCHTALLAGHLGGGEGQSSCGLKTWMYVFPLRNKFWFSSQTNDPWR